jgi:hypothetical protein
MEWDEVTVLFGNKRSLPLQVTLNRLREPTSLLDPTCVQQHSHKVGSVRTTCRDLYHYDELSQGA